MRGRREQGVLWLRLAIGGLATLTPVRTHANDPDHTVTIFVHGFESSGAGRHGDYGVDLDEPLVAQVGALAGLPVLDPGAASALPDVVGAVEYYGDTPPAYYTDADVADVEAATLQWGGGVPRYAVILEKYARHLMLRSGASHANFVSASYGSFAVRWLIEKDVGGLASEGRIARWLTAEGILCGNWAASRDALRDVWEQLSAPSLDVQQMDYDWVDANLHAPRIEADSPHYGSILIGEMASTDDHLNDGALTALMMLYGDFQPNDGIQALPDAIFHRVTDRSRLLGLPPSIATFHTDHFALAEHRGAWVQLANFLTQRRRVTITMTRTQVTDLHELHIPFLDMRPAEIVFESRVRSPHAQARWQIDAPLSELGRAGAAAPLRRFSRDGDTQQIGQLVFDGFVDEDETELQLELWAEEIDYDSRYGVAETPVTPYVSSLGAGSLAVPVRSAGTYSFQAASWNCDVDVRAFDYPFELPSDAAPRDPGTRLRVLRAEPNPFTTSVRLTVPGTSADFTAASGGSPSLRIYDVAGSLVRTLAGDPRAGIAWDATDDAGRPLPAGVYLHRLTIQGQSVQTKVVLIR